MTTFEHVPGTKDYIGAEVERLVRVTNLCASTFESFGYERIILPVLERSDIFLQRSGEEIRSRMYILRDPRGQEMCLRPEMTISAARLYLERMSSRRLPVRLSYQGDVFRYDNVKEGRYRQFLQAGIECIGSENPIAADVEALALALEVVNEAGISGHHLLLGDLELVAEFINSLPVSGIVRTNILQEYWRREAFQRVLGRFAESAPERKLTDDAGALELAEILSSMGEKAGHLLVRQILSLFVEKEIGHRDLDEIAERFLQRLVTGQTLNLPKECVQALREYLAIQGEPDTVLKSAEKLMKDFGVSPGRAFEALHRRIDLLNETGTLPTSVHLNLGFRRGIEYYTGFIFEIHYPPLGQESQVCGGGRYDRLLSALGAPTPIPAVGFAFGLDRLLLALEAANIFGQGPSGLLDALLTTVGEVPEETVWRIAQVCRKAGWKVRREIDLRPLKTILGHASDEGVPFVIIAGEDEAQDHSVRIRDMIERKEETVAIENLERYVQVAIERMGSTNNIDRPVSLIRPM